MDVAHFGASDYDLLVFIGDLGGGTPASTLRIAKSLARLDRETLVIPGNNDVGDVAELAAELSHRSGLRELDALRTGGTSGPSIRLSGYDSHRLVKEGVDVTLIIGRPHSLGGPDLSYPDYMAENYGIGSLDESAALLCELVDRAESEQLIFLGHNGPTGLGSEPHDMWGCDFKPGGGDWGDPDLEVAVAHARARGREVLAVIGGHMHLRTKQGIERRWIDERDGVVYVNAARVPRIFPDTDGLKRHHVSLTVSAGGVDIEEVHFES
jgi:uncharacterized protein (TIGR04168 family)